MSTAEPAMTSTIIFIVVSIFMQIVIPTAHSLPFVVFHGIANYCASDEISQFTQNLTEWSGSNGQCIEIGNGLIDSIGMPIWEQSAIACEEVKSRNELQHGFNMVAISQGNIIGRGVVELCDGAPSVKNFISVGGPQAGIASLPCGSESECLDEAERLIADGLYTEEGQKSLSIAGYFKVPTHLLEYYRGGAMFLPKISNEVAFARNSTYKERFTSLENLVLIMHEEEEVLVPKETSWFGFYEDGSFSKILPANETKLYTEDWIGLKTLDEAGKVHFVTVAGKHAKISPSDMKKYIVPYLQEATLPVATM